MNLYSLRGKCVCMLTIIFCLMALFGIVHADKIPLYIAGLQELSNLPHWFRYAQTMPYLINTTLDKINEFPGILDEYELRMIYKDDRVECNGLVNFFTNLFIMLSDLFLLLFSMMMLSSLLMMTVLATSIYFV